MDMNTLQRLAGLKRWTKASRSNPPAREARSPPLTGGRNGGDRALTPIALKQRAGEAAPQREETKSQMLPGVVNQVFLPFLAMCFRARRRCRRR
jgi:hypothetical protein